MSQKQIRCGLEVHSQLNFLDSKLFCSCKIDSSSSPNKNTCPICCGLPGSLPNINGIAISFGLKLAKALSMKPVSILKFSRKHYDYPDLPKGFQITQNLDGILGTNGFLPCSDENYPIHQIQIEEDPAKLSYQNDKIVVDYNRCGVPLIELVTDPIFTHENQIKSFLRQYRRLLYYLGISDTKKEGSFRADVNVSVGEHPRVEVKNVGSDSDIIDAFKYEVARQNAISNYVNIGQETRNWDSLSKVTTISRDKESSSDYKYMSEGNLPPIEIPLSFYESIQLPQVPWELEKYLYKSYELTKEQLEFLLDSADILPIFHSIMNFSDLSKNTKKRFFWQEYLSWYNQKNQTLSLEQLKRFNTLNLNEIHGLLTKLEKGKISNQKFKNILKKYIVSGKSLDESNIVDNTENFTLSIVEHLKTTYPLYFKEKPIPSNKINYLIGQGIKYSKGKVNPKTLQKLLQY